MLVAGLALILSACTAGSGSDAPAGVPADVLVRAATAQTTGAGSSRFTLTTTTAIGDQDVTLAGEGSYDYAKRNGQLVYQVPGSQGQTTGGTIEQRVLGNDLYLMLPDQPEVFYKLPVSEVAGTPLGSSTDPTAALQALVGVGAVSKVGTQTIRGQESTHYRGEYDVAQALAQTQGPARAVLEATLGKTSLTRVPFDAFLDEQGRMVRFEQRIELPASPRTGGRPLTSTFAIELFDFGTAVTVVPPPGETVRDGAKLLEALKEVAPAPPAPQPVPPAPVPPPTVPGG